LNPEKDDGGAAELGRTAELSGTEKPTGGGLLLADLCAALAAISASDELFCGGWDRCGKSAIDASPCYALFLIAHERCGCREGSHAEG
jgi:hypothetical protein